MGGEMTMKKMCRILACVGTLLLTACTASTNRSTHEILKIELLTWEDNQLIVKEITKMEFNSLPKEPKLIMLGINDRRLLE